MMYGYMTFNDGTEVVHSGIEKINHVDTVRAYFERPTDSGFDTAECVLPGRNWQKMRGFSPEEIKNLEKFVENNLDLFFRFARQGGIFNTGKPKS